ncbi:hypothetical protein EG328_005034 [Venturia inaequalis]|uniref:Zn(2)-C6 fungal-type domain-containing protein n=1 Tax=Venturia inaequalis TaxID=5025 RepID=A0A8H3UGY1_VENIN|nr:hypothetical protein EG327_010645 [Venturia inaequalis]KAE9986707.1 hypothetical protein EG328_005034 [Venturia inaequalis]
MSFDSAKRPAKRNRQRLACEPCRRKKSKCPGEKPACSFCLRLSQTCYYADEIAHSYVGQPAHGYQATPPYDQLRKTEERLLSLESQLAEVLGSVRQSQIPDVSRPPSVVPDHSRQPGFESVDSTASNQSSLDTIMSWETTIHVAERYLMYCDCQPLPLFDFQTFMQSLRTRDPEIIYAILALAMRFADNTFVQGPKDADKRSRDIAEKARELVMKRVSNGPVELSTLQCLCLLSLIDFTNGNKNRASLHSSLAMNLAQCAGLMAEGPANLTEVMQEERRRCFWSIFMLKRLLSSEISLIDISGEESYPWYPQTTGIPPPITEASQMNGDVRGGESRDLGVVAYSLQLSQVWHKTTRYARRRATPSNEAPWSHKSEYTIIVAETMTFETRMPYRHRYKPSGFQQKTSEDLKSNRAYWAPWLFTQIVYHTNLCLLNHPLILALRLRTFKHSMPETFLQHTSDLISTHTRWVVHLIDALKEKDFKVGDPFIGHCAAIVATIFLHESFSEDDEVRCQKQISFEKCFEFVCGFSQWPHMALIAEKLQRLRDTVTALYHTSGNSKIPTKGLLVDLGRFWEVLEYPSASELYESAGEMFGTTLYSRRKETATEITVSALPTPTPLEAAAGMIQLRGTSYASATPAAAPIMQAHAMFNPLSQSGMPDPNFTYPYIAEPVYSNDELAVLADSLFNQRDNFMGNVEDWYPGNL